MKKATILILVFAIVFFCTPNVNALSIENTAQLSDASNMELMEFLTLYGIEIPGGTDNYGYWENFIRSTIETVLDNPDHIFVYNWTVSADFAERIKDAVILHFNLTATPNSRSSTSYTLQDSTKYGEWDDSYRWYVSA